MKETGEACSLPFPSDIDHAGSEYHQRPQQQDRHRDHHVDQVDDDDECNMSRTRTVWEIEEEVEEEDDDDGLGEGIGGSADTSIQMLFRDKRYFPMPSIKEEQYDGQPLSSSDGVIINCVYVAVGKSESSMDALNYAINLVLPTPNTILYLIHIFPEIKYIPSPLGKLPKNQVSPEQVESFMAQESGKRRQLLQKYMETCSAAKVTVDTLLIESDLVAKALLQLIPILNIRKLVLGTNKSNSRKLMSGKGASGIADQVLQGAPPGCDISIICQGNQVMINDSLSPRSIVNADDDILPETPSPKRGGNGDNPNSVLDGSQKTTEACSFLCFKPKFSQ